MKKAPFASALLVLALLVPVQLYVTRPMLLAERLVDGAGWGEIALLALYAAGLTGKFADPATSGLWRQRIWRLFSLVFFGQLLLGLAGVEMCLMTGKLHLPVPAIIVAGPVFRGAGLFMPILLGITVLLVGPAWCSHLCYVGAWDDIASKARKQAQPLPPWRNKLRLGLLAAVLIGAAGLRLAGAPGWLAAILGGAFGLAGVGTMVLWSRRAGAMAHCSAICPIGWLTTTLGRINPFRIRVDSTCTSCSACFSGCRFDALNAQHVQAGYAGPNCTLCGDCLHTCPQRSITYSFPGLSHAHSRTLFVVLVVSLHAAFLGLARI
jgi:polyferredoxin